MVDNLPVVAWGEQTISGSDLLRRTDLYTAKLPYIGAPSFAATASIVGGTGDKRRYGLNIAVGPSNRLALVYVQDRTTNERYCPDETGTCLLPESDIMLARWEFAVDAQTTFNPVSPRCVSSRFFRNRGITP